VQNTLKDSDSIPAPRRAAAYVRASIKHKKSVKNQMAAIRRYASQHGFEIVSYAQD
jgi:hypothetical protein